MQPKLSIIIPAYNVENYISRCLDSVFDQDMSKEDYEVIVVNDGSIDNTQHILHMYTEKYSNLTLINQHNQGQSAARNKGIGIAKGYYLMFVDADDYIKPQVFDGLCETTSLSDLDVLGFNYYKVKDNHLAIVGIETYDDSYGIIIDGLHYLKHHKGIWSPCMYLFRRTLFNSPKFLFKPGITSEDSELLPRLILKSNRVMVINEFLYYYFYNPVSTTKNKDFTKSNISNRIKSQFVVLESTKQLIKDIRMDDEAIRHLENEIIHSSFLAACSMLFMSRLSFRQAILIRRDYTNCQAYPVKPMTEHNWRIRSLYRIMNSNLLFSLFYFSGAKYLYSVLKRTIDV